jgi:hypothetical protein
MWRVKGTYDVAHEEEDAEVVGLAQTLYALMDVLWVEAMISQAGQKKAELCMAGRRTREKEEPEKEDAGCPTDLIVREDVAKFFWDIANGLDNWIKTLTWVNNDGIA